jgi:hypothetical protein
VDRLALLLWRSRTLGVTPITDLAYSSAQDLEDLRKQRRAVN